MGEFATERSNGILRVTCLSCDQVRLAPDKGIGRANIAAWKTRHQHLGDAETGLGATQGAPDSTSGPQSGSEIGYGR